MNGGGSPQIALFPYSNTHNGVSSFTYTIPIDPNLICYIVAAQALVGLSGGHAVPVQYEPAWINQCLFNEHDDSGAMYGKYCLVDCEDDGFGNIETKPAIVSTKF